MYVPFLHAAALDRAYALVEALGDSATVVSPLPAPRLAPGAWTQLPDAEPAAWRQWVLRQRPSLVIVDGAGAHARAVIGLGARVAVVAQVDGEVDSEIGAAYSEADVILAPWASGSAASWPTRWQERTVHIGALSWQAARAVRRRSRLGVGESLGGSARRHCVVLTGTAAGPGPRERRAMMVGTSSWTWTYAPDHDLQQDGPVWDALWRSAVAVCAPTSTNLAALAALRKPAVLVVAARSAAQAFLASAARHSAPVVERDSWPEVDQWRALLEHARGLDPDGWSSWSPEPGLEQLRALASGAEVLGRAVAPGSSAQV